MGQFCQGQVLWTPIMSSYVGNGAYSSTFVDVFSALKNQASFSQLNNSTYGIYGERRYFLKELNYYRAIAVLHTSIENFAISGTYSGTSDYNETELGIAHARMLGEKITI